MNERHNLQQYPLYFHNWATQTINGSHVTVGVVDSGIYQDPHLEGRVTDILRGGVGPGSVRYSGHGVNIASAIGGVCHHFVGGNFACGQGVAPGVSILNQYHTSGSIQDFCKDTVRHQGTNGFVGSVQNNSWSIEREENNRYGDFEQQYDFAVRHAGGDVHQYEPLIIVFGSGNSGVLGLRRPTMAKNIITVGASWRTIDETGAESFVQWDHSSIGDCPDGRIKPDLIAPTLIPVAHPTFIEQKETYKIDESHRWFGGTSAAAAVVSGGAALLVDWWEKILHQRPTPAMIKAILINDAVDMKIGGSAPNFYQGWGQIELARYLNKSSHYVLIDRFLFQEDTVLEFEFEVIDEDEPIVATLVWDDEPAPLGSERALVNNLSLEIKGNEHRYYANAFVDGFSVPTSEQDNINNVKKILLPKGTMRHGVLTVRPLELLARVRKELQVPNQDGALVIYNVVIKKMPVEVQVLCDDQNVTIVMEGACQNGVHFRDFGKS